MSTITQPAIFQDHLKTLGEILENLKKIGVHNADQRGQNCKLIIYISYAITWI